MTSVGKNINSYDSGGKPFQHDPDRGKWRSISSFYLGCIGHAFNMKCFTLLPLFIESHGGIFFIFPFTIGLFLFALPIFILQSFLGQFSSTGSISVFRISPLFKGIGYVILALNIVSICYYSAIVAYPLVYFFISFNPSLPWMSCNNSFNSINCTTKASNTNDSDTPYYFDRYAWSTLEFFEYGIANFDNDDYEDKITKIAWPIFFGSILIWILLSGIFYKGFDMVNLAIRSCSIISLTLFSLFFVRVLCLPGAWENVSGFIFAFDSEYLSTFVSAPFMTIFIFGSGWGTVLTMASYNHFKADVVRYSQWIGLALMMLFLIASLMTFLMEEHLYAYLKFTHYGRQDYILEFLVVSVPYLLGHLEAANFWSMIFYGMLFLCEFCGLLVQLLTITTAIFDEFENLRSDKQKYILLLCSCLGLASLMFTTNKELIYFTTLFSVSGGVQVFICLLELIVVVWFYGRQRFQRDFQFMLGNTFATWKFFLIRFITPLFIIFLLICYLFISIGVMIFSDLSIFEILLVLAVKILPFIFIPAYCVFKLLKTTGTLKYRFKKSIWPNDWYPADPIHRQRYEETLGASDISHQLIIMKPNDEEY